MNHLAPNFIADCVQVGYRHDFAADSALSGCSVRTSIENSFTKEGIFFMDIGAYDDKCMLLQMENVMCREMDY